MPKDTQTNCILLVTGILGFCLVAIDEIAVCRSVSSRIAMIAMTGAEMIALAEAVLVLDMFPDCITDHRFSSASL